MGRVFSILTATFISVLAALATWNFTQAYLAQMATEETAKQIADDQAKAKEVVETVVNEIRYEWKSEERTNPVTGATAATATRFSEDTKSLISFRCHGGSDKQLDVLISFPEAIDWYRGYANMQFRLDGGELSSIGMDRSSSSTARLRISPYGDRTVEFRKIGKASKFEASISDGTIYDQTISIDLDGIETALAPVLTLCGKDGL